MLLDSHCHPDDAAFDPDRAGMLERAAGVLGGLVAIAGLDWLRSAVVPPGLKIWTTVGVHPHEAAKLDEAGWAKLQADAGDPRVIAIGEIGLDYHYDHSPREVQREAFERQLGLAAERRLPVSIHCREAWDDCLAILGRHPRVQGVFHCFTGSRAQAEGALALGWYLSFSGLLTFPKLGDLREIAAWAPADRILVETDAPYLAPVPYRGRRNEPAWVAGVGAKLAEVRKCQAEEIEQLTTANFFRLFPNAG